MLIVLFVATILVALYVGYQIGAADNDAPYYESDWMKKDDDLWG